MGKIMPKKNERAINLKKILNEIKKKIDLIKSIKETKIFVSLNAETLGLLKCSITLRRLDIRDFNNILYLESEQKCDEFMGYFKGNKKSKSQKKNQSEMKLNNFLNQ